MAEVTHHTKLLRLLGEWVTVTHPDAPHRVWHGKLRDVMHAPCIVLDLPGGGTQVLPQAFDVVGAAPAADGPHPDVDTDARPFQALRDTGLLWLINRVALHPRGLALALHLDEHGQAYGWSLISNDEGEPWMFDPATDNDGYTRAEATITKALAREPVTDRCRVCGGGPAEVRSSLGAPLCSACLHCDCGQDVCVRTNPDGSGYDRALTPTSADTVRTRPDADVPPGPVPGLRVEYRTRVPRHLAPFALAEVLPTVADAREQLRHGQADQEPRVSPGDTGCSAAYLEPFHGRARCERHPAGAAHDHEGTAEDGSTIQWNDNDPGATPPRPDHMRAATDGHPDTEDQASGRTRPPVLGTGHTSTDTVRTAPPDTPDWKVCGDRSCIDPRCREEATLAEARERLATAMELPLGLLTPIHCDCGQTGPLVGEAANGHHFHISPEQHEALQAQQEDGLTKTAWGKCWDRAEALRADLNKAHSAYEALRARVLTTSRYVHQQQTTGFPFRGGDHRQRILDTLAVWTDDPGPLHLTTLTPSETP